MPHSVDGDILSTAAKDNGRLHFWTFAEPFRWAKAKGEC